MKKYVCVVCGFIYGEAEAWPTGGIQPGALWEEVPPVWQCPDCGMSKDDFEMVEI